MRAFIITVFVIFSIIVLPTTAYQVTQWRNEENRKPLTRAILVVDGQKRPLEGVKIKMKGQSFRPIFPIISFVLQRGVWHPGWESEMKTTGKDGIVRFSYKSDSAHISELIIGGRRITTFSNWWYHADGTLDPADVYLVPESRRDGDKEEKDTVIIMK